MITFACEAVVAAMRTGRRTIMSRVILVFAFFGMLVWPEIEGQGSAAGGADEKAAAAACQEKPMNLAEDERVASAIRLLEGWIESQMAYRGLPGMSIGIVYDQELIWAKGFGYAHMEQKILATPQTLYRIASISKLFTSTAILQLRDAGKLQLDDSVTKHLPWFQIENPYPDAPVVTIRHLLTHTSGLPRESPFPYFTDFEFPTSEQIRKALPGQQAVYASETRWKYSNLALTLAGEVVAAVSGQAYADYVEKHILEPLGMGSTQVGLPETSRAQLATGYGRRMPDGTRQVRPPSDLRGLAPAGALSSSVEDLARFAALQFRDGPAAGKQILKGSTLREMHRVHWLQSDWKSGWGLGFHVLHTEDRDLVGHGGWLAGYQSAFYTSPREKIAVIALINADDGRPYPGTPESVIDRAFQWVAPAITKAVSPELTPDKPRPEWQTYVGKYRNPWGDAQVLIRDGKLIMINPIDQDPAGTAATLQPVGEHAFRIEGGSPFGPHGERVVFELGQDGKVSRVKVGENYTYPEK
jgi:CubicO group peptidase (beta-lactamase class C family)